MAELVEGFRQGALGSGAETAVALDGAFHEVAMQVDAWEVAAGSVLQCNERFAHKHLVVCVCV